VATIIPVMERSVAMRLPKTSAMRPKTKPPRGRARNVTEKPNQVASVEPLKKFSRIDVAM